MFKLVKDLQAIHRLGIFRNIVTTTTNSNIDIVIPHRIERNDTDLLKALASTVKQDVNGPRYMFHDDPYLTPVSNNEKRKYSLSKESGRKAARFIRDKHPFIFNHHPDDPILEPLLPSFRYDYDNPTEKMLTEAIRNTQVTEATKIYKACCDKEVELSMDCLQSLLELVSFYNSEDAIDEEWLFERRNQQVFDRKIIKTWKDSHVAEEIFNKISSSGSRAYCALIRGMCKYYQVDRAWQLYQETLDKKVNLDTETFCSIISIAPVLWDGNHVRWENIENLLSELKSQGHPPTLSLMNRLLDVLDQMAHWEDSTSLSLRVLKEFKLLGIEPSLGSYSSLLGLYRRRGPRSSILITILDKIQGRSFEMIDPRDSWFFFKAMEVARRNFHDWDLCQRVHELLLTGDNYNLIGEQMKETIYYRHYMLQAIESMQVGEFMNVYDNLCPNIYSAEIMVLEELLKSIGVQDSIEHLPRVWSDIIQSEFGLNEGLVETALMVINNHDLEQAEEKMQGQLLNIVWDIWTRINSHLEDERVRSKRIEWSGAVYGDCMSAAARIGDREKTEAIVSYLKENANVVIGDIPIQALEDVIKGCKKSGDVETWMNVLTYMKDHDFEEMTGFAQDISKEELTTQQRDTLRFSFGINP